MSSQGYVFLCANSTEKECYDRLLLGGKEKYQKEIPIVTPGDLLFLFNYQEGLLHGVFEAVSEAKMNIEPGAWKGEFPWQVKVVQARKYKPLSRADLIGVLTFKRNKYPPAKLAEEQLSELLKLFEAKRRLPNFQNAIPYTSDDGHRLRSEGERIIDNWLYSRGILHAYEKQLIANNGVPETMYCDFYIPEKDVYIEYWGLSNKQYQKRMKEKINFYLRNNLNLIEVFPTDLRNVEEKLSPLQG